MGAPIARPIRRLPDGIVNRIAAGEVVERPASVVKELVENALDAGAGRIDIELGAAGRELIQVQDDGHGMAPAALELAVQRHATSKLEDENLVKITTLGFRGEALPSIGAVSRLRMVSRTADASSAWALEVAGGEVSGPMPAPGRPGTRVEVRDLFWQTPARRKFLRSDRAEAEAVTETVRRLALARPRIGFSLRLDGRTVLDLPGADDLIDDALARRVGAVLGREFEANALEIAAERDLVRLAGFAALPTLSRGDARLQFLSVNQRSVQDRMLKSALRVAYSDLLFHDRQPIACLAIELPHEWVDVNVHPAKAEVRFRDAGLVRGLVIGAIKRALAEHGHRASSSLTAAALGRFTNGAGGGRAGLGPVGSAGAPPSPGLAEAAMAFQAPLELGSDGPAGRVAAAVEPAGPAFPLGAARAQLHENFILAETVDGLVIVDQHAAHERIVYERLKAQQADGGILRQGLLMPVVVELEPSAHQRILEQRDELADLGLVVEPFGTGAVLVREVPALLHDAPVADLVAEVAADLDELGAAVRWREAIDRVLGRLACHGSVRAGRRLAVEEMNALLRTIETGSFTGQCIHGRPTYIELKLADIERLFARR